MTEFLTTKEIASFLRIKERKVYDLAASGKIPCSRATGKLLFPKADVERWVQSAQSALAVPIKPKPERAKVLLGSHDPLLEWALRESGCGIASFFDGSFDGLKRYEAGEGIAAGLHIFDPESNDWNIATIKDMLSRADYILMEWAKRQRGLVVAQTQIAHIRTINDLQGCTVVPRQAGAGSQRLLDHLLQNSDIDVGDMRFTSAERTENDAILPLLNNTADATLGLQSVAEQYQLGFVPLIMERFDLLINRREWFEPGWQRLIAFCHTDSFQKKCQNTPGYDFSAFATIHLNSR